jgi:hypothetical protein
MKELADLPPVALIALGVTLAFIFVVRHFGLASGQKAGPENKAPIAAVIVDPTALNKATAAVEEHTAAVKRHTEVVEDVGKHVGHLGTEMNRIREELRIWREIERNAR